MTSVKSNWFVSEKYLFTEESVKIDCLLKGQWKLTVLIVKNILFTGESVKSVKITDSTSKKSTDSDSKSTKRQNIY